MEGDLICPKCKQRHLRTHSLLVGSDVHYELECLWCGHREGDYETITKAKEAYEKKYGGNN